MRYRWARPDSNYRIYWRLNYIDIYRNDSQKKERLTPVDDRYIIDSAVC
jgi:hypothetical protein